MRERRDRLMLSVARVGMAISFAMMFFFLCGLALSATPALAQIEMVPGVVEGAVKVAEALPADVVRLCLTGIIIMAIALLGSVAVFLKAHEKLRAEMMAQISKQHDEVMSLATNFTQTMAEFAAKPCLKDAEHGRQAILEGVERAVRRLKKRQEDEV